MTKPNDDTLIAVMEGACAAIGKVRKAFGAPGDYGYGSAQGDALFAISQSLVLLSATIQAMKEGGQ